MTIAKVAKQYGITESAAKQFLKYGQDRAKYGLANASINKPQLESLHKAGFVVRGGCSSVQEVTELGMQLYVDLSAV